MNDFISNVISRHANPGNIVRPRGRSIFESLQPLSEPLSEPLSTPFEKENFHPNLDSPSPESKEMVSHLDHISTTEVQKDNFIQQEETVNLREVKARWKPVIPKQVNRHETTTGKTAKQGLEKMNLKTETFTTGNERLKDEKGILNKQTINSPVLQKVLERQSSLKNNIETANSDSKKLHTQSNPPIHLEKILVNPNNQIHQRLVSNFNINNHNEYSGILNNTNNSPNENKAPTIKIHIGRIDIKAVKQNTIKSPKAQKRNKSGTSLEQFLKKREGK